MKARNCRRATHETAFRFGMLDDFKPDALRLVSFGRFFTGVILILISRFNALADGLVHCCSGSRDLECGPTWRRA